MPLARLYFVPVSLFKLFVSVAVLFVVEATGLKKNTDSALVTKYYRADDEN